VRKNKRDGHVLVAARSSALSLNSAAPRLAFSRLAFARLAPLRRAADTSWSAAFT
jgi:hypothetical protein